MYKTSSLYQNDSKWKDAPLGNQARETIGSWGCLLTSITMMLNGAGYNETPETVNEKLKKVGGFDGALLIPAAVPYAFPNMVYKNCRSCEGLPAPVGEIDAWLAQGKPVIVQVDWNKASGIQTHWLLLKEKKGNDYVIYDPYQYPGDSPTKELLLTSRYKFQGTRAEQAISFVFWFDVLSQPAKPPEKPKVTPPADALEVYVAEDDLALRAEAQAGGYLYKRMVAGAPLTCLEAKDTARGKIGVNGQWLNVQTADGVQGYSAAWYLSTEWPPAEATQPAEPPASPGTGTMLLLPTSSDLALRRQPVVADSNLIKRLPQQTELTALEPLADVIRKVGVVNQWLKVKDATGAEGYVAAWYVTRKAGSPGTAPQEPPAGGALNVHTTVDQVALRSQPVVANHTLVKRLALNTALKVTEGKASQVGVANEWLKVQDSAGAEGYVAAWFVA